MKKKLRIGIIFGGRSGEHEVSLLSAASILNAIDRKKYDVVPIAIDKQGDIYWNTKHLSGQDELKSLLRGIVRMEPQPEVHIRGDSNVRYQFVGQVLVATQQIGIRKVAFITTPDHFGPGT